MQNMDDRIPGVHVWQFEILRNDLSRNYAPWISRNVMNSLMAFFDMRGSMMPIPFGYLRRVLNNHAIPQDEINEIVRYFRDPSVSLEQRILNLRRMDPNARRRRWNRIRRQRRRRRRRGLTSLFV